MTLGGMLEETARRMPNKCAVKFGKHKFLGFGKSKITFRQLNETVNKVAHGLQTLGIEKGDRVGILSENCPEYIIGYFAVAKLGATAVPINNFLVGDEIKYIANDCQIKVLLTSQKFLKTVQPVLSQMESIKHVVVIGDSEQTEHTPFTKLLESEAPEDVNADITDEDLAVFIYTSGTTGHPKGAMLTHKNLISNAQDGSQAIQIVSQDRFLLFLPMFHSFTFTVCVLIPILKGATIVLIGSVRALDEIKKAILFDRVTIFVGVPAVFNVIASKPTTTATKITKYLSAIKFFVSGSAPLPAPVIGKIEEKFGSPLCEGYGLSEASPVVAVNPRFGVRKVGSVGPPIPNVEVKVVDSELNELPVGETGELAVKGANVMKGYYNLSEATKETLIDDGWLLTGDIARIDEDGYIYIVDRKKDMLLVRGINVYPREIEEVLYTHPSIAECAVIGVPDESKGEVPKAFIVVQEGESLTEQEVRGFCKQHLAAYKIPKHFEFRPSLPKSATQKIMKRTLRGE
jgi:long-chain acyl-CoA synthetase